MGLFGSKKDKPASGEAGHRVTLEDGTEYTISQQVDCLGDSCPRPQLMTKKALSAAAPADVVEVLVDNPTSMEALPPMCAGLSATHLGTLPIERGWLVYIQKN